MINLCFFKEFRTAAPFHRLHPSQRSVSETALNNPRRTNTGGLSGAQSGSMSVLTDNRRDLEFGSNSSLPTGVHSYRGGTQKTQSMRNNSNLPTKSDGFTKSKPIQPNVVQSLSSSSESG